MKMVFTCVVKGSSNSKRKLKKRKETVKYIMLLEKMNSANVTHHLGKSSKTKISHQFPFQDWHQADKLAIFELAFRQLPAGLEVVAPSFINL